MDVFKEIIKLSKSIASSLLRDKAPEDLENSQLFNKQEKKYILDNLTDEVLIKNRLNLSNQINKKEDWNKIKEKITVPVFKLNFKKYASVAALLALFISISYLYLQDDSDKNNNIPSVVNTVEPGSNKAILTLEDGSEVVLEKGSLYQNSTTTSNGEELVYNKDPKKSEIKYNQLTVPRGGQFFIKLSDGTKVWLNSDSKLIYQVSFIEGEIRQVELVYGEAYFDVSPNSENKGSSFKVIHKKQEIQVLGTQFNIKAYNEENNIYTTLVEGKIALTSQKHKHILKPNQKANLNLNNNSFSLSEVDIYNEISWKDGVFSFEDKSLKEIMVVLSRWYDVEIEFQNKLIEKEEFIGVLGKNQNLESILLNIKSFGIIKDFKIQNKKVILY